MFIHFQYAGATFELKDQPCVTEKFKDLIMEFGNAYQLEDQLVTEEILSRISELVLEQPELLKKVVVRGMPALKEDLKWGVRQTDEGMLIGICNDRIILMCCGPRLICMISTNGEPDNLPWNTEAY